MIATITTAILGAAIAISVCGLMLVFELAKNPLLASPSWARKRIAWICLLACESVAMGDRIYYGGSGRVIALVYISLFTLGVAALTDSYRLMLQDLTNLHNRIVRAQLANPPTET